MLKLQKHILIKAPPEKVFDLVDDTAGLPEIWRNLSNIRDLKRIPNGGHSFEFDYRMAGFQIKGSSSDLEHVRPSRIVTRTSGGLIATLTWNFNPSAGGSETSLVLDIEYEVPVPVVGRVAEHLVAMINNADITYVLTYLKLKLERGRA